MTPKIGITAMPKTTDLTRSAVTVAPQLLGCRLVVIDAQGNRTGGIIVETEAYMSSDEASHSFRGISKRTAPMFGPAGHLYVYFIYGMHVCANIVVGREGDGQAVLIRALEPTIGLEHMSKRRFGGLITDEEVSKKYVQLTNGPGKLCQALGITLADNNAVLNRGRLLLQPGKSPEAIIVQTTRIGITKAIEKPWRWYIQGNQWVSKK